MKYIFVSLGRLESIGVRIGGSGLGNMLFPWARSVVYQKNHRSSIRIGTTWRCLKIGTLLRKERDSRMYLDCFRENNIITGLQKFILLNFTHKVRYFSGMDNLFVKFQDEQPLIKEELMKIIKPSHIRRINNFNEESIGVHVRMGDFEGLFSEKKIREGAWNYRLPIKWYVDIIKKIRSKSTLPIYIFSDGTDQELIELLEVQNCDRVYFGSAISDMIALSKSRIIVASGSTFSMWSSFLGQKTTIWFPGQMRQRLINNKNIFEGELDYQEELPDMICDMLNND